MRMSEVRAVGKGARKGTAVERKAGRNLSPKRSLTIASSCSITCAAVRGPLVHKAEAAENKMLDLR